MKLTRLEPEADLCRLRCEGNITCEDVQGAADPLDKVLGDAGLGGPVLLSLEEVPFIDSAGVGWLVRCQQRFRKAGGRLVVHSVAPMVDHMFQLLRLPSVLNLARDERAARAMAREDTR